MITLEIKAWKFLLMKLERQFLNRPYILTITVLVPSLALGYWFALSTGAPIGNYKWNLTDYIVAFFVAPMTIIAFVEAFKYFRGFDSIGLTQEEIDAKVQERVHLFQTNAWKRIQPIDQRMLNNLKYLSKTNKQFVQQIRRNQSLPPIIFFYFEKIDRLMDRLIEHSEQQRSDLDQKQK